MKQIILIKLIGVSNPLAMLIRNNTLLKTALLFYCFLISVISNSQTSKDVRYHITRYSVALFDENSKKWVEGKPVVGSEALSIVFYGNENKIFINWKGKGSFNINKIEVKKFEDYELNIYTTIDEDDEVVIIKLFSFNDGRRMIKSEIGNHKIVYLYLESIP